MIDDRLKDKKWRISHLYKIVDKDKKLITYKPNSFQQNFNQNKWYRNIILKARQLGFTTNACVDGLDDVLFNRNFTMVIIAQDKDAVIKIFKKVKIAWDNFPQELKDYMDYVVNTDSRNELSFNNGSSIRVAISSRADTVNRLHISEFGKICNKYPLKAEEIVTGAIPSVPENGRIDIESTAEGDWGAFYDMFTEAEERGAPQAKKQFKSFFYSWAINPEYAIVGEFNLPPDLVEYQKLHNLTNEQINWYYIEKQTQKEKMMREYPTTPEEAFLSSGHKMFDLESLEYQRQFIEEGEKIRDWVFFRKFVPSHRYGMGGDVAEGVGQDSSTAVIIDFTKLEVVAIFKSNTIAPDMFAHELKFGGQRYGDCLIAVERNNHGHATLVTLKTIYNNIFKEVVESKAVNVPTDRLGWLTTRGTKPKMLYELSDTIKERELKLISKQLLKECQSYEKEDLAVVRFDPEQTKHWDLVIACAIAWQMKVHTSGGIIQEIVQEHFDQYNPL